MSAPANPKTDRPPGIVLAGGRSSRMGSDKAAVMLGGKPLLRRVIERLSPQTAGLSVNSNTLSALDFAPGIAVFSDTVPGHAGPMAGVLAAMRHTAMHFPAASHVVTVPTDTPFFPLDLVARLQAAITRPDQIAVAFSAGTMHPVFALWPVDLADELEHWLQTDEKRRVRGFIEKHYVAEADFPALATIAGPIDPFFNVNTPADLVMAERWLALMEETER
ncbi:molybdenum cofactor guanylyltransferase MobA [Pararhizobium sp. BT-229]|uniref:molybdenum cofactor guanylyltransferase MobA n=1 Tax=Pararhizobium sp. BT-229 TaxID=2986923 RepID=UPI0021F6B884|nr:molybdenum cofactor guanylyltransferase MobA [Pararhizobium sp. BT-229]MCV9960642.1 molybdenum cofactor guanylyltransferase MobA [Pararhizobium sp. BT-229]